MIGINNFTNEEKVLFSSIVFRIHRKTLTDSMAKIFFIIKEPIAVEFSRICMELLIEIGITPDIAENTPISKFVWDNMGQEKQAYILKNLQKISC